MCERDYARLRRQRSTSERFDDITTALKRPESVPVEICGIKIGPVGNKNLPKSLQCLFVRSPIHVGTHVRTNPKN